MQIIDFIAAGSTKVLARAIEEHAESRRVLQAIVVPWESSAETLTMAVTSVKADGWAIEHTNVGTIQLTDLGSERTRISVVAHDPDHPEKDRLVGLLQRFAQQLQTKLQANTASAD